VLGVDPDGDTPHLWERVFTKKPRIVLGNISTLLDPLTQLLLSTPQDDILVGSNGRIAVSDSSCRGITVPVITECGASHFDQRVGKDDVDLGGLIIGILCAGVACLREAIHLPPPGQDRKLLQVHLDRLVQPERAFIAFKPDGKSAILERFELNLGLILIDFQIGSGMLVGFGAGLASDVIDASPSSITVRPTSAGRLR
jgi:hypothetical protein